MKQVIIFVLIIVLTHCKPDSYTDALTKRDNIITEGKGFDSFQVDETKFEEVIKILGQDYEEIKHNDYSIELKYEGLGISFYFLQKDSIKKIFGIHFQYPFRGQTASGIKLNQSTIKEAIAAYGKHQWTTCKSCDLWRVQYNGISFGVERDKSLPYFPLNEAAHIDKKIIEITITKKYFEL